MPDRNSGEHPVDHSPRPRIALICHADDALNRVGLATWLASWAQVVGIVAIQEPSHRARQRIRREVKRVGWLRFLDVIAFRLYAKFAQTRADREWEQQRLQTLQQQFGSLPAVVPTLITESPNSPAARAFLHQVQPDMVIARCKTLLAERIFTIPRAGTFVMHPGICPRYRNAHGVFWALANDDAEHAGMTLLKIDRGVDTGPVYGYFRCEMDPLAESHIVLQHRTVFDNLTAIEARLRQIVAGQAMPLDTRGEPSGEWGQPWLSAYWRYRSRETQRRRSTTRQPFTPAVTASVGAGAPTFES